MKELKWAKLILFSIFKSIKGMRLYPQNHPALEKIINESYATFLKVLKEAGRIRIEVHSEEFRVEGLNPDEEGKFSELAHELFVRGVKTLIVDSFTSIEEFKRFLTLFQIEPEEVIKMGGAEEILNSMKIKGIRVEVMDFLLKSDEEIEKAGRGEEYEEVSISIEEFTQEEKDILALVEKLKEISDLKEYEGILKKVVNKCQEMVALSDFKILPIVLLEFSRIFIDQSKPSEIRRITGEAGRSISNERVIGYLINKIKTLEPSQLMEYGNIFLMIGDTTIKYLLESLFVEESIKGRRFITDIVIRFGKKAIPHLIYHLNDQNWFVVRNCLFILGEIGDRKTIDVIYRFAFHKDERVKKEAINAISKIKDPFAISALLKILDEADDKTKPVVIRALGNTRDRTLEPIIFRFMDSEDPEMKKECVLALAKISSPYTLRLAKKIISRAKLPRDKNLLESALSAIEIVGTPEAVNLLESYLFGKRSDLKEKAVEVLFRISERVGI
jgi:HEAT repeat protein